MGAYEDAVEQLREAGLDDLAETFEGFTATKLRQKAGKADQLEAEKAALESRIRTLETRPKLEKAFRDAGVDFDELRPAEREAIFALEVEDEITDEFIAEHVSKYELPTVEGAETQQTDGEPKAAAVVAAANAAPKRAGGGVGPSLKPEEVSEWSTEKIIRFKEEHPTEFEALKRGETVTGVAFA